MGEKAQDWKAQVSKSFEDWVEDNIEEISYMQGIAAEELPAELDKLMERDRVLAGFLSRSGELLADVIYYRHQAIAKHTEYYADLNKPTLIRALAEGKASSELRMHKLIERLNRSLTHILDNLRTQISLEKERYRDAGRHR